MALDGGGGGGGLLGSANTFTGTANSIEILGDHCYVYSGSQDFDGTETTVCEFTTGNYYVIGKLQAGSPNDGSDDIRFKSIFTGTNYYG